MMSFLLNPTGWLVKACELVLLFFVGYIANDLFSGQLSFLQGLFFILLFLCFVASKLCVAKHWYPQMKRGSGIERHFFIVWILAVYLFLCSIGVFLLWRNALVFFFPCLPLGFLLHFHPVLITFHLRDRSALQPNAFSHPEWLRHS